MWKRFAAALRCALCHGCLELDAFEECEVDPQPLHAATAAKLGLNASELTTYVEEGQLVCPACRVRFPIVRGLPVMLPYTTASHEIFSQRWANRLAADLAFASGTPAPGEDFVRASFSTEWLEYDYDGVIWELSYRDHEVRFRKEVGSTIESSRCFLEVGCGLGLATAVAQTCSGGDCVGLDLSVAVSKAARHFRGNPFLHFVQASAFAPPFAPEQFDVVYSRGVLHHTYSTRRAFESVAPLCRRGGVFFLWLYGPGSIFSTPLRVALFGLESVVRPLVSRAPDSLPATMVLRTMALAYVTFNGGRRLFNPEIEPLTFRRGVHAARDRFTPRFAHRHSAGEICAWFRSSGFDRISVLDWREMPAADQDDFRRNVGVRAQRVTQTA